MTPNEILIRPVVTEKSTLLQERGKYVFQVSKLATKRQIASSVEEVFDVACHRGRSHGCHCMLRRLVDPGCGT